MRQYIYKIIISSCNYSSFEFTIGKEISRINEKIDIFGSAEGEKKLFSQSKRD